MKMIELWNPVPKGSTSSPTKRSFRDQQISEPVSLRKGKKVVLNLVLEGSSKRKASGLTRSTEVRPTPKLAYSSLTLSSIYSFLTVSYRSDYLSLLNEK